MPETQEGDSLPGVLASIVATKRLELMRLAERADALEAALSTAPPVRDFARAIGRDDVVSLIAECKRRSPGAGAIRPGLVPVALTTGYEAAGASAISVLTDATYFGGALDDLTAVVCATQIPVLRKDFTLDPLQLLEARGAGADAVLLIVRILDDHMLQGLHTQALALGMSALVEVHDAAELERALRIGATIVGINNRDLATFTTDLDTTVRLLQEVPEDVVVVSESGIRDRGDVERLGEAGVNAVLVGEAILVAEAPAEVVSCLSGVVRGGRGRG